MTQHWQNHQTTQHFNLFPTLGQVNNTKQWKTFPYVCKKENVQYLVSFKMFPCDIHKLQHIYQAGLLTWDTNFHCPNWYMRQVSINDQCRNFT